MRLSSFLEKKNNRGKLEERMKTNNMVSAIYYYIYIVSVSAGQLWVQLSQYQLGSTALRK